MEKKKGLRGKLSDFWTIPFAIVVAFLHEQISILFGWFQLTPEKIGKIVPALVVFLLVLGISRLISWAQFPDTYGFGLMKNDNESWKSLDPKQKFLYSWLQRLFLAYLLGLLVTAM